MSSMGQGNVCEGQGVGCPEGAPLPASFAGLWCSLAPAGGKEGGAGGAEKRRGIGRQEGDRKGIMGTTTVSMRM